MKHKLSYIFTVALIISFVLVWQYSNKTEEISSSTNPVLIPVKEALLEVHQEKGFQQLNKKEKLEKTYQVLEQLPQEYEK